MKPALPFFSEEPPGLLPRVKGLLADLRHCACLLAWRPRPPVPFLSVQRAMSPSRDPVGPGRLLRSHSQPTHSRHFVSKVMSLLFNMLSRFVVGKIPGEGNRCQLQYSGLENSMNRTAWQATVHGIAKSQTRLSDFHFQPQVYIMSPPS